jgi:hypothetical protein
MEKQHKLMKHFLVIVFKMSFIILITSFLLFSCKRADDAWNELNVRNATNDTLTLNISKRYISDVPMYYDLLPNKIFRLSIDESISGFDIIRANFGDKQDTIEIYRNDTLMVKWGGPLRSLPDSIHSFYNENSWEITNGGQKNKYVIATFTITEDDFR